VQIKLLYSAWLAMPARWSASIHPYTAHATSNSAHCTQTHTHTAQSFCSAKHTMAAAEAMPGAIMAHAWTATAQKAYTGNSMHVQTILQKEVSPDWMRPFDPKGMAHMMPRTLKDPLHKRPAGKHLTLCVPRGRRGGVPVYVSDTDQTVYELHVLPYHMYYDVSRMLFVRGVGVCMEAEETLKQDSVFVRVGTDSDPEVEFTLKGSTLRRVTADADDEAPLIPSKDWVDVSDMRLVHTEHNDIEMDIIVAVNTTGKATATFVMNTGDVARHVVSTLLDAARARVPCREVWRRKDTPTMRTMVNDALDAVVATHKPDIHPGSKGMVNDLLHPSLHPHIAEEPSTLGIRGLDGEEYPRDLWDENNDSWDVGEGADVWGRRYENST